MPAPVVRPLKKIAFFCDLPQDVAVLRPLATAASTNPRFAGQLWLSSRLQQRWPESLPPLQALDLPIRIYNHYLLRLGLAGPLPTHVLITASDTSEPGHYPAHRLTKIANRRGLATFTLQHGLENIGLSYRDDRHGPDITFAGQTIFTWQDPALLPAWVRNVTRGKCVGVGRSQLPVLPGLPPLAAPYVLVGQNLHWHRYDAGYRAAFAAQLRAAAAARPDLLFLADSHPGHRQRPDLGAALVLPNVRWAVDVLDKAALPAGALLRHAQAVITTPSTVALDAAQAGVPTAVFTHALDAPIYEPLPLLRAEADWTNFLRSPASPDRLQAFVDKNVLPGDAIARMLDLLAS